MEETFPSFVAQTLSLIAASPQILPSIEYYRTLTSSSGFSLETATLFSFPIKHILTFILPFFFGNPRFEHIHTFNIRRKYFLGKYWYIGILPFIILSIFIIICFIKNVPFSGIKYLYSSLICFLVFCSCWETILHYISSIRFFHSIFSAFHPVLSGFLCFLSSYCLLMQWCIYFH